MKHLRPYQTESADKIQSEWQDSDSTLLVLPTGCGKTIVFAEIIRRVQPKRALVLAHREELIFQAKDKIERFAGIACEIEMADRKASQNLFSRCPAVISTIQTQIAGKNGNCRMNRFKPDDFGVLIVDESHHAPSDSYKRVIDYYRKNPDLKVLGVTATPDRFDEKALGQVFKTVAFDYEILDAINDGWLVPIEQQFVRVQGLDFSGVKLVGRELNQGDLARVMEDEKNLQGMTASAIEIVGNRKTLVFTSSVKHAEMTANIFNRHRAGMAEWACGETPELVRQGIVSKFFKNQIQVLVNCGLYLEGFDDPSVEVIVMGRPTCSRSLYAQMAGRATRPLPGIVDGDNLETPEKRRDAISASKKPSCLLIDYVGNSRHKLMTSADILGGKYPEDVVERAISEAQADDKPVRMSDLLQKTQQKIEEEQRERERQRREEEARRAHLVAKAQFTMRNINPFDVLGLRAIRSRGWDEGRELTEKQKSVLTKRGIDVSSIPYSQAKQLLDELFRRWNNGLCSLEQAAELKALGKSTDISESEAAKLLGKPSCTPGQAKVLCRAGYDPFQFNTRTASAKIDKLKANNWKKLPEDTQLEFVPEGDAKKPILMLTEKEQNLLRRYHYPVDKMDVKEGRRVKLRIIQNGFKPLPQDDPDNSRNWKPKLEQEKSEPVYDAANAPF